MIKCKKGMIEIDGEAKEVMADWQTVTVVLYKIFIQNGFTKEQANSLFVEKLFQAIAVANATMEEE